MYSAIIVLPGFVLLMLHLVVSGHSTFNVECIKAYRLKDNKQNKTKQKSE